MEKLMPIEHIETKIYFIRDQNVMLDRDLARLYGVETKVLKQAVRRNRKRFPGDFMFELSKVEFQNWRSQFVTSNSDKMGLRYAPMAFTEHGVAMLSSVLNSEQAIQVNIQIMRAFSRTRKMLHNYEELKYAILDLGKKHDEDISFIFMELDRLNRLLELKKTKGQIGFQKDS